MATEPLMTESDKERKRRGRRRLWAVGEDAGVEELR